MKHKREVVTTKFIWVILVTLLVIGICFAARESIVAQLHVWQVLPKAESVTELYFEHPNNLPKEFTPGESLQSPFVVRNNSNQAQQISYRITQQNEDGSNKHELVKNTVHIAANQQETIHQPIVPVQATTNINMTIELLGSQQQSINYWVTRR